MTFFMMMIIMTMIMVMKMMMIIVIRAYVNYVATHGAGDDGRGDWEARKSCNYVNVAIGVFLKLR